MAYQVLARKWRPQTFEEVVGQKSVTQTLRNAIQSERVAHAFLFSGGRGVGKTTTARILAKALNCVQGPTSSPCCECVSCQEIAAGNSVDVLEVDAASNTGVDNIRELRENVRYATARDRFKIFIIDEVHMLSNAAFNALLKTLEEPPPHVKFILATTEHHKIPATITSRCQQFEFQNIPFRLILDCLRMISREEGIEVSEYALLTVVSAAQGSLRDAQSTLDQLIAFCGKTIGDDDVRTLLGVVDERRLAAMVDAIIGRDRKVLLEELQELSGYGIDPQNFCTKLIGYVRNLLVCKVSGWDNRLLHLPDSEKEKLIQQTKQFSQLDLIRLYDLLNRTESELRWNAHPLIHLEMALMKLIELAELPALEQVIDQLDSRQARSEEPTPKLRELVVSPTESEREASLFSKQRKVPSPPAEVAKSSPFAEGADRSENPVLSQLIQVVQREAIRLYSSLQHASQTEFENGKLSIVFPAAQKIHHDVIAEPESVKQLGQLGEKVTGSLPKIDIRLLKTSPSAQAASNPMEDPGVQVFLDEFPGKVIVKKEENRKEE